MPTAEWHARRKTVERKLRDLKWARRSRIPPVIGPDGKPYYVTTIQPSMARDLAGYKADMVIMDEASAFDQMTLDAMLYGTGVMQTRVMSRAEIGEVYGPRIVCGVDVAKGADVTGICMVTKTV